MFPLVKLVMVTQSFYGLINGVNIASWNFSLSFTLLQLIDKISLKQATDNPSLEDLFHIPLSVQAFNQFETLQDILNQLQFHDGYDSWSYS